MGTRWILLAVGILLAGGPAAAEEMTSREIERRLGVLAEEIERLKTQLVIPEKEELRPYFGLGPAASKVYGIARGVSLAGYGELTYENFKGTKDDGTPSGKRDQADFLRGVIYLGYKFSERVVFNSEIEFEHASTGKKGEASVEFAYLDFLLHPAIHARVGMLLIPMGWVNEQHEPVTFHGVLRPDVERFIIPTTWRENGAGVFGEPLPGLEYRLYAVAGLKASGFSADSGIRGGRQSGSVSLAEDLALTGRLDYKGLSGLTIGASFFAGNSGQGDQVGGQTIDAPVTLWDLHAQWRWRGIEVRALYAEGRVGEADRVNVLKGVTGKGSIGSRLKGGYLEVAYDLLPLLRPGTTHYLAPFVRYERLNTQAAVPAGYLADPANNRNLWTMGLTYKPIPNVAVKFDYQDRRNRAGTGVNQWNLGVSYLF
jgi:hypothetical protein